MGKLETGGKGEQLATEFLRKHGYRVIERNYHCRIGEVDIIAREGKELVFVEVRTRESVDFGEPEESIDLSKQKRLVKLSYYYIIEHALESIPWRIDVVTVRLSPDAKPEIRLLKNAVSDDRTYRA